MKTKISILLGAALCLLGTVTTTHAGGKGPGGGGGGGTPTGTIYYIGPWPNATHGGTSVMTSVNPDGSNMTNLGLGLFGVPSRTLHGGYRWFVATLGITGEYYPDGSPRRELFAFREDYDVNINNTPETRVQLTDDATLKPWGGDWVPGDAEISLIGVRYSSTETGYTVEENGIYTVELEFDANGNITGLVEQPTAPTITFPLVEVQPGDWQPDLLAYSWDPAGERVTYTSRDGDLWVANRINVHTPIFTGPAHAPQWSPDGSKIAFTGVGGIWTIKPNGAALKLVVPSTSTWFPAHVFWSPTGSHFVFAGEESGTGNSDVFLVPATGGAWVNLTSTPAPFREALFEFQGSWR